MSTASRTSTAIRVSTIAIAKSIATDLFELKSCTYLLVIDYFSQFIEIAPLKETTSADVIGHLKSIFACHGIPETICSDNGPQYSSHLFKEFARDHQFIRITSSPKFPQSNGGRVSSKNSYKFVEEI